MVVISNLVLITSHPLFYEDIFKICHQCHNRFSGNMKKDKHIYTCQLWAFLYVFKKILESRKCIVVIVR